MQPLKEPKIKPKGLLIFAVSDTDSYTKVLNDYNLELKSTNNYRTDFVNIGKMQAYYFTIDYNRLKIVYSSEKGKVSETIYDGNVPTTLEHLGLLLGTFLNIRKRNV